MPARWVLLLALLLLPGAGVPLPAVAQAPVASAPAYRFKAPRDGGRPGIGAGVLTAEEQAFLAGLPEVRVGVARPDFRPYEVIDDDGTIAGVHVDMLVLLARGLGLKLRPVVYDSFGDMLDAVQRREVDLLMSLGVTSARSEFLEFTLGATPMVSAIFARQGHARPPETARFGLPRKNIAVDYVRRRFPDARVAEFDDASAALAALAEGYVDLHVGNLLPTLARIERMKLQGIEVSQIVQYGSGHFHYAVRKDWAPLARILNRGLSTVRDVPSPELAAALQGLPSRLRPPPARPLPAEHLAAIIERPVWRVGAVRGLTLLNEYDASGRHSGIAADYTEAVAQRLGVGLQLVPFDSVAAMLDALRAGRIDVVPLLTRTEDRARDFGFSRPYVDMPYMIVARSDAPLYWDLASLRGRRLALTAQHPLREIVARQHPGIQVVDVPPGPGAMDAVMRGDADAAVEVKFFANLRIHGDNDGRLRAVAVVDELPAQFHFATSHKARSLLPLIDDALAGIEPAERQRMFRRWVALDLSPAFPWRRHAPWLATAAAALLTLALLTAWWMRRLQREVHQRRRSEQVLADIATHAPGVAFRYVLDERGALEQVFVSPSVRTFLGIEPLPGRTLLQSLAPFLDAHEREAALAAESACAASGERFRYTGLFHAPGGTPRWLHCDAVQSRDAAGRPVWTGYVVDVSAERELQRRLAREAEARNLLLAAASHELRAPTHNLSLALQSIAEDAVQGPAAAALRIARRTAHTLAQLLNDVLDAARFESGRLRLQAVPFELHPLLDEVAEAWLPAARDRGLSFTIERRDGLPTTLYHDPLRLRQILTNLLSNACKYTQRGGIRLVASTTGDQLRLEVHDTGPGLDAAARERLFRPFETLGPVQTGSSGLGLMVCRQIAQLMGGQVEVDSVPGQGSVFALTLPLRSVPGAEEPVELAATAGAAEAPEGAPGVVVCDDDPVSRMLVAHMLRLRGYRAIEVSDGAGALAAWQGEAVDALVTDLDMPGMSGQELIEQLRETERRRGEGRRTTVVVCSGSSASAAGRRAPVGHDAMLLKPVALDELVRVLRQQGVEPAGPHRAAMAAAR